MLEDGAPAALFMTQDQRRAAWALHSERRAMISLTTNTRGNLTMPVAETNEVRKPKSFEEMSRPELIVAFNTMVNSTLGQELGAKPVQRFADTKVGIKRCEMLASSIKARASGLKREEDPPVATKAHSASEASTPKSEEKAMGASAAKKTATKTTRAAKAKDAGPLPKGPAGVVAQFGARAGTNREKLLTKLAENIGKMVSFSDLITATYGRTNKEDNKGATAMVLKGVDIMIKAGKLPFELRKEKGENGHISYGLFKK